MKKPIKKGIFIVGVRKCGTTSVYQLLSRHSQISAPRIKEPQFFCLDQNIIENHLDTYLNQYNKDKIILDGSTLYYQYPESYRHIREYCEQPFFILCLRDPAKRMYSAYWHMRSKGMGIETRSFGQILDELEGTSTLEILEAEKISLHRAIQNRTIKATYVNKDYHKNAIGIQVPSDSLDPYAFFRYFNESIYSNHYNVFSKLHNTHIIFFENFLDKEKEAVVQLHKSINLSMEHNTSQFGINVNKTKSIKYRPLQSTFTQINQFMKRLDIRLSPKLKHSLKSMFYEDIPAINASDYRRLRNLMSEEFSFWFEKYPDLEGYWKYS